MSLLRRATFILLREGPVAFIGRSLQYLSLLMFRYAAVYLYEHSMEQRNEAEFRPKTDGFSLKIISTNKQAGELAEEGFEDIRLLPVLVNVRKCLDSGAIAFCFFAGRELAQIGWVALDKEAKNCFDILPYQVDFSNKQACTGGTVTMPKYRGNGFMRYGYYKRFQFLLEKGYSTSRNVVERGNIASQKAHQKFNPRKYARGCYLKVLFLRFWKESPLD